MLEGQNITCYLGPKPLFSSLHFTLEEGEMLGIKGKNGSGKTTLLRLISGLTRPTSGTLLWNEKPVISNYSQHLLYIGHKLCLYPEGRVKDHLKIWRTLYSLSDQDLNEALSLWGCHHLLEKKVGHLSQGQQKRLSLTRCSWLKRSLWILDEPHVSLDQEGKNLLQQQMETHLKQGGMICLATHDEIPCTKEILL